MLIVYPWFTFEVITGVANAQLMCAGLIVMEREYVVFMYIIICC